MLWAELVALQDRSERFCLGELTPGAAHASMPARSSSTASVGAIVGGVAGGLGALRCAAQARACPRCPAAASHDCFRHHRSARPSPDPLMCCAPRPCSHRVPAGLPGSAAPQGLAAPQARARACSQARTWPRARHRQGRQQQRAGRIAQASGEVRCEQRSAALLQAGGRSARRRPPCVLPPPPAGSPSLLLCSRR